RQTNATPTSLACDQARQARKEARKESALSSGRALFVRGHIGRLSERHHVTPPDLHRLPLFPSEIVFLINRDDAGKAAARMIQQLFDYGQGDAKASHAACHGAPEVMQAPRWHAVQKRVEATLALREAARWRRAGRGEDVGLADPRQARQDA